MENALWSLIAIGLIANAYSSEARLTNFSAFKSRLRQNFLGAGAVFLAVFFLGSLIQDLGVLDSRLIALNLSNANSFSAPYIAAIFVSGFDLAGRTVIGLVSLRYAADRPSDCR